MKQKTKGILLLLATASLWGLTAPYIRFMTSIGINIYTLFFAGAFVTTLTIWIFSKVTSHTLYKPNKSELLHYSFVGIIGYATILTISIAFLQTKIATAQFLHYLAPILAIILAIIFLKEKLTRWKIISIALAIFGILFIFNMNFSELNSANLGNWFAIISAFTYAFYLLGGKTLKNRDPLSFLFWTFLTALPVTFAFFYFNNSFSSLYQLLMIIAMMPFMIILPHILYFTGLTKVEMSTASIILMFEVPVAVFLANLIYSELPELNVFLGGFLIIASCLLLIYKAEN